jgi:diaminohydroxyphosphoribosylaminopyrimidine deaminase/5-amino-6-(5-phosphoribosylamino)uracil reductase
MKNSDHHIDTLFMKRALELARLGMGYVSPNPLVGSVVVYNGKIIGEGWHKKYGGAHAEVNAIQAVVDKSLLSQSTVYVNLEPCSHFGKTPPCANMLIAHQVKKVVVANLDSNPQVAGTGIDKLRAAGIEVITGVMEQEGRELNKRFFTFMEKQRPYIILKWAQTTDGFVARQNHDSKWISNEYSRQLVHKWRTEEDSILIGTKTAMHDNPSLNVRDWSGRNPVRIVIDKQLVLGHNLHLFDGTQKTICYNVLKDGEQQHVSYVKIDEHNFHINLIKDLYKQKIESVIIEGGAHTLNTFIQAGLWDEARIFTSHATFEKGIKAPALQGILIKQEQIMTDTLQWYKRQPG